MVASLGEGVGKGRQSIPSSEPIKIDSAEKLCLSATQTRTASSVFVRDREISFRRYAARVITFAEDVPYVYSCIQIE